ncbi:phage tail length tape measure family protein [Mesorhizobium soli]|uniref:phage tail length tape measure family protein n=1 Tax=Pseudaminobacter soli (ex Li et al. 2025) TaxID=1295366 RepID=UPI0015E6D48E
MVQQISALIVQPALDASKYTPGANAKVAADRAMAESAKEAGAAQRGVSVVLTDTSAKLTVTGDVLARLSRTYVEGARQTQAFGRDLNALNRALETGKAEVADVANVLVGMQQKLGLVADSSTLVASGQTKLAAAVDLANSNIRQQTTLLNEVAIAEAKAAQQAENHRQIAAANQNKFNTVLGVSSGSSSAAASAGVFTAEFDRLDQIARQKATQIGQNFVGDLNASLIAGAPKSASVSASAFQAEFDRLDQIATMKAQHVGALFQQQLNESFGIGVSPLSARSSAAVFEEAGREADQMAAKVAALRAELNPLAAVQDRVNAEIAEYSVLAQRGMISAEEFAKAQAMARARGGQSSGAARAAGFNAGQQIQDIAMMSLIGQNPMTLALQQGPQLATAIQQGGGLAALGTGLASVFSTTTLLTVGITAATAATIQWFMKGKDGANGMADAIAKNDKAVRDLAAAYKLADFNADELGKKTVIAAEASERISRRELERQIRQAGKEIQGATSPSDYMTFGLLGGGQEHTVDPRFAAFTGPIREVRKLLSEGKADFATLEKIQNEIEAIADQGYGSFRTFVDDMARMVGLKPEGIRDTADDLQDIITKAAEAARRLEQLDNLNRNGRRDRVVGPNRMEDTQEAARRVLEEQRREREIKFSADEERLQAQLQQQRARTNAERLAAAERVARAEGGDVNAEVRIRRALAEERTRQEVEARDAAIQRSQAIERSLQQQRLELDLIGKTTGEQAKLRFEFERMQELREQAARTDEPINDKEVAKVKAAAEAMKQYADAAARTRLQQDLLFDLRQMGRSQADQSVASQLRSAGLPEDLDSEIAKVIRMRDEIARMKGTWEDVFQSARDGIDGVVDALFGDGSIEDALRKAGQQFARMMFDMAATNPAKNWLTGSNLNSIADLGIFGSGATSGQGGGFGGVLGNLLGAQKAVGAMQVQAATVVINGSVLGGAGGIGTGLPNILGGTAANDNFAPPKFLSGIGSPTQASLGDPVSLASGLLGFSESRDAGAINSYLRAGGVNLDAASQAWCAAFVNSSLKQIGVNGSGSNVATSFLNWGKSVNPADVLRGDVLVQSRGLSAGQLGGHVGFATGLTRMDDKQLQLQMLSGNTSNKVGLDWYNASDLSVRRATAGTGNMSGLLGSSNKASEALDKLATSSIGSAGSLASGLGSLTGVTQSTMQALEQFGIGANNLGSMLQNLMTTGGGFGGNWFANLAGMFGGAGGAVNYMNSISPAATASILKGGVGLFATGAAFWGGNVVPFANGDVFHSPAYFPMSGGKTGMLGEAGPEAIMPLRRGSDGRLGVAAQMGFRGPSGFGAGQIESLFNSLAKKMQFNSKIVNVFDPSVVGDYLRTDEGEQLVMNIQRRNS